MTQISRIKAHSLSSVTSVLSVVRKDLTTEGTENTEDRICESFLFLFPGLPASFSSEVSVLVKRFQSLSARVGKRQVSIEGDGFRSVWHQGFEPANSQSTIRAENSDESKI